MSKTLISIAAENTFTDPLVETVKPAKKTVKKSK